jgi:hypothetical protein
MTSSDDFSIERLCMDVKLETSEDHARLFVEASMEYESGLQAALGFIAQFVWLWPKDGGWLSCEV